jgi:hypothetical protein
MEDGATRMWVRHRKQEHRGGAADKEDGKANGKGSDRVSCEGKPSSREVPQANCEVERSMATRKR